MAKDIMDVKEVAVYLGFSPTKIYRMLTSGEIAYVKVGGQYRFPKAVIDDWLAGKLRVPDTYKSTKSTGEVAELVPSPDEGSPLAMTESGNKKGAGNKRNIDMRAEDEIVGHLIAFNNTGAAAERKRAKKVMVLNLDALDWQYLAGRAETAGALDEAIAIEKEINKGG